MLCFHLLMFFFYVFLLMIRRPPRFTRTDTLFPYTTLFRSIVIDQMRELSARLGLSSGSESGTRVAIVEPADAVNYHAWNAILKTLEEPQPGRYLWLVV